MKQIAVMFSGGIDSSYLTTRLDGTYDRIRLVTFDVPWAIRKRVPSDAAGQLMRLCTKSEVTHEYVDLADLTRRIRGGLLQVEIDNRKVGHAYSWCLGCKMSMHVAMILYAKKNGIDEVADGSKGNDAHAAEQTPEAVRLFDEMYARHGVQHTCPVYDDYDPPHRSMLLRKLVLVDDNAVGRRHLKAMGFKIPPTIMNQDRLNQPFCPVSFSLNVLRLFRREEEGATTRYFELKRETVDRVIREELGG
jgi:hypothetical protein